jgi:hypothetical protein
MPNDIPAGSTAVAAESEVFAAPVAAPGFRANRPLHKLSVVIPARDEEGCIVSTVEHLLAAMAGVTGGAIWSKLGEQAAMTNTASESVQIQRFIRGNYIFFTAKM